METRDDKKQVDWDKRPTQCGVEQVEPITRMNEWNWWWLSPARLDFFTSYYQPILQMKRLRLKEIE